MRIDTNDKQLAARINRIWNHCKEVIETEELPFPAPSNRRWFYEDLAIHCVSQKYEDYAQRPTYRVRTGKHDAEEWSEGELLETLLMGNNLSMMVEHGNGVGRLEISMVPNPPAEDGFPTSNLEGKNPTEISDDLDFPTREKMLV